MSRSESLRGNSGDGVGGSMSDIGMEEKGIVVVVDGVGVGTVGM